MCEEHQNSQGQALSDSTCSSTGRGWVFCLLPLSLFRLLNSRQVLLVDEMTVVGSLEDLLPVSGETLEKEAEAG